MEGFDIDLDSVNWTVQVISMAVGLVIGLVVQAVICTFAKKYMDAIPQAFHEFESWQIWLLMIPCWSLIWNFFVFPRMARSYRNLFEYSGVHDTGDSGAGLAMTYCVLMALGVVCCTGVVAWVFIILFFVRIAELSRQAQFVVQQAWDAHQAAERMESRGE